MSYDFRSMSPDFRSMSRDFRSMSNHRSWPLKIILNNYSRFATLVYILI